GEKSGSVPGEQGGFEALSPAVGMNPVRVPCADRRPFAGPTSPRRTGRPILTPGAVSPGDSPHPAASFFFLPVDLDGLAVLPDDQVAELPGANHPPPPAPPEYPGDDLVQPVHGEGEGDFAARVGLDPLGVVVAGFSDDRGRVLVEPQLDVVAPVAAVDGPRVPEVGLE